MATLISVAPRSTPIMPGDLAELLAALRWAETGLDQALPPRAAYAGAWHPVIAAATRARLADLDYDMEALADLAGRGSSASAFPPSRTPVSRSPVAPFRCSPAVAPGDGTGAWRGSGKTGRG
jgi:predicted PhzF superfamily epimerase YddE/YHI9